MEEGVVGTLSVHRVLMIPRPCRFDDSFGITNNYVLPEVRGRGIAGGLVAHVAAAAAAAEGLELLIVWPSEPAIPLYSRAGFRWENEVMELRLRDYVPISAPRR
jgi:GNAT superfamily N-acetyltransferase